MDIHSKHVIDVQKLAKDIYYSEKYVDESFEYRHVMLPKELLKLVPKDHLMSETEWRSIGVQQSRGWIHYMIHEPEPHVLLFRRSISYAQGISHNQIEHIQFSQQGK